MKGSFPLLKVGALPVTVRSPHVCYAMAGDFSQDYIDLGRRRVVSIDEQSDAFFVRIHLSRMRVRTGAVN